MNWNDACDSYATWLLAQPLAKSTKRVYLLRVRHFVAYAENACLLPEFLKSAQGQRDTLEAYSQQLLVEDSSSPVSINNYLTAVDHFFQYFGLPKARIRRHGWLQTPPVVLSHEDEKRVIHVCLTQAGARDRCLVFLQLMAGLRLSECASLNIDDVAADRSRILVDRMIRLDRSSGHRTVALDQRMVSALDDLLQERDRQENRQSSALLLTKGGQRMSLAGIDYIIRRLGWWAYLALSAQLLRNTYLARRLEAGDDLGRLAHTAGLARVDSLLRYAPNGLPMA